MKKRLLSLLLVVTMVFLFISAGIFAAGEGSGAPKITKQPQNQTVSAGQKATFKVTASGDGLKYQWYYLKPGETAWTKVSTNGTSATYSLTAAARHNGYSYRCTVKNAAGSVDSDIATLTVGGKPVITVQPEDQAVKPGEKATFRVAATGDNLTVQWYYQIPQTTARKKVST